MNNEFEEMDKYLGDSDIKKCLPPNKFDFCWYIETDKLMEFEKLRSFNETQNSLDIPTKVLDEFVDRYGFPIRPRKLYGVEMDILKYCHASKLEHCENVYRIYDYSDVGGKGVFRGPSQQLVVESIPKEDEWTRFAGLLIFNEHAYNAAVRDHKNYWEWVKNRNKARWVTQEAGEIDYDVKNLMHCVRLIKSGRNILEKGEPIVKFTGQDRDFLLEIRKGYFTHDFLMKYCEGQLAEMDSLYKESDAIPDKVNMDKIHNLYLELRNF